jgi:hypothetical protein
MVTETLSGEEAARLLGVPPRLLRSWLADDEWRRDKLPGTRRPPSNKEGWQISRAAVERLRLKRLEDVTDVRQMRAGLAAVTRWLAGEQDRVVESIVAAAKRVAVAHAESFDEDVAALEAALARKAQLIAVAEAAARFGEETYRRAREARDTAAQAVGREV